MGVEIKDVIVVQVNIQSPANTGAGFGTPTIFSETVRTGTRMVAYTSLTGMTDDGYETTDVEYIAASDLLGQDKQVEQFYVGKKLSDSNCTQTVTFDVDATAGTFTLTLGTAVTTAIAYDALVADVKSAIESIVAITAVTVALNTGGVNPGDKEGISIEFTGADANTDFDAFTVQVSALTTVTTGTVTKTVFGSATESWATGYVAIKAANDAFYCLTPTTKTQADIQALAALVETDAKIMIASTADSAVITNVSTDVASILSGLGYDRTAIIYNSNSSEYLNVAWAGRCLPESAGSINWANTELKSVTADTLTAAEVGFLVTKKCNWFQAVGGYNIVPGTSAAQPGNVGGIMVSGEFIDTMRGADNLVSKTQEGILAVLVQQNKIPFTAAGFSTVEGIIYSKFKTYGEDVGYLAVNTTVVTLPDLATYDSTKKGQRWLDGVVAEATLAGAINKVSMTMNFNI